MPQGGATALQTSSIKPILRWAGSKRQILPKLASLAPEAFNRYIEPFCGSACFFLALNPKSAVLSDINPHLIATYKTIQKQPDEIAKILATWKPSKEHYLTLRARINAKDQVFNAARFLYLNRYCFNGVYRENLQGIFNVPYGGYRTGKTPDLEQLQKFSGALRGAKLICGDFTASVDAAKTGDFVYIDPPYFYGSNRNRGQYGWNSFSDNDIDRLINSIEAASARGAQILISYNKAHVLKKVLSGWTMTYCTVKRSVAGFSNGRADVREFQLRNY